MRIAENTDIRIVPLRDARVRELIDVPLSSLYEMARRSPPELPGIVRVGRRVMIDLVALKAWASSDASSGGSLNPPVIQDERQARSPGVESYPSNTDREHSREPGQ